MANGQAPVRKPHSYRPLSVYAAAGAGQSVCEDAGSPRIALTRNKLPRSENGKRYVTDQKLIAFVNILKVPVIWLLGGTNDPTPKH